MANNINQLDPQWAWSRYVPDDSNPWDRRQAAHLLRRAGFAATRDELSRAVRQSPSELVKQLIAARPTDSFESELNDLTRAALAGGNSEQLAPVWLYRMLRTPAPLLEKVTLFWHGHFATSAAKVEDPRMMQNQNDLFRRLAFDDFGKLVHEISRDPAMLIYLDSTSNRKSHPNENYARELLELFSMGEGNYREQDILELARCFTGWQIRRGEFRFNRYQHDFGGKDIFDQKGEFDGQEAVDIVLRQPHVGTFIARKLVRYFVFDEPAISTELLEPLARDFRDHQLNVGRLVERILGSQLFFSPIVKGRKVRSPVELAVGFLRSFEGSTNAVELSREVAALGQHLFYPPNVKGWDGGRSWINSSTLLGRANLIQSLLHNDATRFAGGSLEQFAQRHGLADEAAFIDWAAELLLAVSLEPAVRERLIQIARDSTGDRNTRLAKAVHALGALP